MLNMQYTLGVPYNLVNPRRRVLWNYNYGGVLGVSLLSANIAACTPAQCVLQYIITLTDQLQHSSTFSASWEVFKAAAC